MTDTSPDVQSPPGQRGLLAAVIDQFPDDVILVDSAGTVAEINRSAAKRLGGSRGDFVGKACQDFLDEAVCHLAKNRDAFWAEMRRGRALEYIQNTVDPSGAVRYFGVFVYPVCDESGALTHVVIMRRDVTQRVSMEHRLLQSERLAAVGELATYVAHEIRNPLFAIAGFANTLLRSQNLDDKAREKVSIILEESGRLDTIIKNLLNFARPTQGAAGEVDVARTMIQTMGLMGLGAEKQGVRVEMDIAPVLARAKGDPDLIKQCLINLVKNSLEAMPDGGLLILSCRQRGDLVVLEVRDTGRGIPAANISQVFNPFFSTKDKSIGLGLAMTRKIVGELGGSVELESEEGKGTTVRLVLAPVEAEAAAEPGEGGARPRRAETPDPGREGGAL